MTLVSIKSILPNFLPAWRAGVKVREAAHPKFYWFDPGVARAAAGWLRDPVDRPWEGFALETLVFHELRVYNEVSRKQRPLYYYLTAAGVEIDFIIETVRRTATKAPHIVAIEVKRSDKWNTDWNRPLISMSKAEGIEVDRLIGVYTGERSYRYEAVEVMPYGKFCEMLHKGEVF